MPIWFRFFVTAKFLFHIIICVIKMIILIMVEKDEEKKDIDRTEIKSESKRIKTKRHWHGNRKNAHRILKAILINFWTKKWVCTAPHSSRSNFRLLVVTHTREHFTPRKKQKTLERINQTRIIWVYFRSSFLPILTLPFWLLNFAPRPWFVYINTLINFKK